MAKQTINLGSSVNKGDGDPLRTAFTKINENFTELYTALGLATDVNLNLGAFEFNSSVMTTTDSTPITIDQQVNITSDLVMSGAVVPSATDIYDLGSPTRQWRSIYLTGSTVYFDGVPLSVSAGGTLYVNGEVAATPGGAATWDSITGKPSMFDIGGNVIGIASSTTISEETPGGTISEITEIESQIEIETTGIVIAKRTRIIADDTVTTSTDEAGSTLTVNNSTASIKHYVEPDGPNNGSYFQVSTSNIGAVLEGVNETLNGTDYGRVLAVQNAVTIGTSVEGVAKYWLFDYLGGLTLPTPTSQVFTLTFDSTHYTPTVGKPSLELTSEPWQLEGQVMYEQNGNAILQLNNIWPTLVNPGYSSGDAFTFSSLVHGLSDYTLTITLNDVVLAGGAGWTADVAASQLPAYPSSILANGAIKLTADSESWVFGTDGNLHFPDGSFQGTAFVGIADTARSVTQVIDNDATINTSKTLVDDTTNNYGNYIDFLTSLDPVTQIGTTDIELKLYVANPGEVYSMLTGLELGTNIIITYGDTNDLFTGPVSQLFVLTGETDPSNGYVEISGRISGNIGSGYVGSLSDITIPIYSVETKTWTFTDDGRLILPPANSIVGSTSGYVPNRIDLQPSIDNNGLWFAFYVNVDETNDEVTGSGLVFPNGTNDQPAILSFPHTDADDNRITTASIFNQGTNTAGNTDLNQALNITTTNDAVKISTIQLDPITQEQLDKKTWTFGNDGDLTLPGGASLSSDTVNGFTISQLAIDEETTLSINFGRGGHITVPIAIQFNLIDVPIGFVGAQTDSLIIAGNPGKAIDIAPNDGANGTWSFGTDGNLQLPAGSDIVDSEGNSVLGSGGSIAVGDGVGPSIENVTEILINGTITEIEPGLVGISVDSNSLTDDKEVKVTVGNTAYFALISRTQQADTRGVSPQAVAYDILGNMITLHVSNYDTGNDKLIISKFSDTGELSWQKQLNNHDVDLSVNADLVVFDDNSMVITFTIDSYSTTDRDSIAVMKLDDEGGLVWSKVLTGNQEVEINEPITPSVNTISLVNVEGTDYQVVSVGNDYTWLPVGAVFSESTDSVNWTILGNLSAVTYDSGTNTSSLRFPLGTFSGDLDSPTKSYRFSYDQVNSWHETSAITTDGDDVFVIAEYQDGASGPNLTKAAILKLAGTNGNLIWAKILEVPGSVAEMYGADVGADGNIVAVGYYSPDGPGLTGAWVNKFDGTTGAYIWGTAIAGLGEVDAAGGDIVVDSQNNVFVTLNTREDIVIDLGNTTKTIAYIVKIDSTGSVVWSRRAGPGPCASVASGIDCDDTGNVYLSVLTVTQDNPVRDINEFGTTGKTTMALAKYSTDGEVLWQRYIESDHYEFIGYDDINDSDYDYDFNYNRARNLSLGPNGKLAIQCSILEEDSDGLFGGDRNKQGVVLQIDQDGREMTIGSGSDKFTVVASRIPGKFVTLPAEEGLAEGLLSDLTEDVLIVTPTLTFVDAELAQVRSTSQPYEYVFGNNGTLSIPNDGDIRLTQTQIGWFSIFGNANNNNDDVWFRANCVDSETGDVYAVGQDDNSGDGIVVRYNSQGQVVWSIKLNDIINGNGTRCNAVKLHPTNGNIVVLCEYYGNQTGASLLQIDPETARVVVSAGFRDADENSPAIPYDFSFDGAGNIIVVGRKYDEYNSISVTPQTGSTTSTLYVLQSVGDVNANDWYVSGTGITGRVGINTVNRYTPLSGTTRQGSGAVFLVLIDNTGAISYLQQTNGGSNYLSGHKIKIPYTSVGGSNTDQDIIVTVTSIAEGGIITGITYGFAVDGPATEGSYGDLSGTNYQVGSGFELMYEANLTADYASYGNYAVVTSGSNYVENDIIVVPGTSLDGTSPANDLTVRVSVSGGQVQYVHEFSGTGQTSTFKIAITDAVDFSGAGSWNLEYALGGEAFVYKGDDEFGYLWSKVLSAGGIADTERYLSVAVGGDNAIYAAGEMIARNNVAGADLNSYWCAVVSKFDTNGTHAWTKALNTTLNDSYAKCVSVQGTNTVVVSHQNTGDGSTVITKLDAAGNIKWQRNTTSNDDSSVAVDTNGDIYAVVEAQFENRYENCIKLIKFNAAGEIAYRKFFGTLVYDLGGTNEYFKNGRNLTLDADNLYVSGYTTAFTNNYDNSFLVKLPKSADCEGSYSGWVLQNDIYNVNKITSTEAVLFTPVIGTGEFESWTPDFSTNWWDPSSNDEYHTLAEIVDRDGGAIEFADGTRQTSSAQQIPQRKIFNGADHRLQPEDSGRHIFVTNSDTSIVVPYNEDSPLPIGFTVVVINDSGSIINIDADGGGITVRNSSDGNTATYWDLAGYGMATLIKVGENYWYISGNVTAD